MIKLLFILPFLLGQTSGFTVSFLNLSSADTTAVPILDNNGNPIAVGSGFVAAGTFAARPGSIDEVRSFTPFGEGNSAFSNSIGFNGFFDSKRSAPIPLGTTDAPANEPVYLVIGDGANVSSSTEFAVFDPGLIFGTEDTAGFGALDIIIDSNTLTEDSLVYGTLLTNVDTGLGLIFNRGIKLGNPLTYSTIDGKVTITDCHKGATGELVIPDTIGGNPVTSIGYYAFSSCPSLTSITIPDTVTSIGDGAFDSCTSLTSITLPDGVTNIGQNAFINTEISYDHIENIFNFLISRSGQVAYLIDGSNASGAVNIPASINSAPIALIANSAFYSCDNLTSITIPDSVTNIGHYAFKACTSLTSITIPDSVTSIGQGTFEDCSDLTTITIPGSVTSIGRYAFKVCTSLTSIVIPDSVTSIEQGAFEDCRSLMTITIPDSVTSIGQGTFQDCRDLTTITIGNSVNSIERYAFKACTSLTSITIPDSVTRIGQGTFEDCISLMTITIPDSVTSIGQELFRGCSDLTNITIGNGVTSIANEAFVSRISLTSITLPDSVTSIGNEAFVDCTSLSSITFPDNVTSIGIQAFKFCRSLTSITFQGVAPTVGSEAFSDVADGAVALLNSENLGSYKWNGLTVTDADHSETTAQLEAQLAQMTEERDAAITERDARPTADQLAVVEAERDARFVDTDKDGITDVKEAELETDSTEETIFYLQGAYDSAVDASRLAGQGDITADPATFALTTLAAYNGMVAQKENQYNELEGQRVAEAQQLNGIIETQNNTISSNTVTIGSLNETIAQKETAYATVVAERDARPTQTAYDTAVAESRVAGQGDVTTNPSNYSLTTSEAYNTVEAERDARFIDTDKDGITDVKEAELETDSTEETIFYLQGTYDLAVNASRVAGRGDVTADPATFALTTLAAYNGMVVQKDLTITTLNTTVGEKNALIVQKDNQYNELEERRVAEAQQLNGIIETRNNTISSNTATIGSLNETIAQKETAYATVVAERDSRPTQEQCDSNATEARLAGRNDVTTSPAAYQLISISTYNTAVAERDARPTQAAYDTVVTERDARPTQTSYNTVVAERNARPTEEAYNALIAERDTRPTIEEVKDARLGSVVLQSDVANQSVKIRFSIEETDDFRTWTKRDEINEIIMPLEVGKRFYRFALEDE